MKKTKFVLPVPLYTLTGIIREATSHLRPEALTIKKGNPLIDQCFTWNISYHPSLPASFMQVVAFEEDGISTIELTDLDLRHADAGKAFTSVVQALEGLVPSRRTKRRDTMAF